LGGFKQKYREGEEKKGREEIDRNSQECVDNFTKFCVLCCVPEKDVQVLIPETVNVTLFENIVFADIIIK
jgi:hypothetical protein